MKSIFKTVIDRGSYDLPGLLKNIDQYHIEGKLSDSEREELYELARAGAKPEDSADLMNKLKELEARVASLENGGSTGSTDETVEEFVTGKWYYTGDMVRFNGKIYSCIAPISVVCVWSPADYPAYWEEAK